MSDENFQTKALLPCFLRKHGNSTIYERKRFMMPSFAEEFAYDYGYFPLVAEEKIELAQLLGIPEPELNYEENWFPQDIGIEILRAQRISVLLEHDTEIDGSVAYHNYSFDYSPSVLPWCDITQRLLNYYFRPIFKEILPDVMTGNTCGCSKQTFGDIIIDMTRAERKDFVSLGAYVYPLKWNQNITKIVDAGFGTVSEWVTLQNDLHWVLNVRNKSIHGSISHDENLKLIDLMTGGGLIKRIIALSHRR